MTRKEALEYVNNMWMSGETHDALETLIPEFGKTGSDKVIDHEDKYKEALLEARAVLEPCLKYSNGKVREALDSIDKELKRFESEDERIRKLLVWQVYRNIEDETNDLAQSVYDGIKGHDPDIEESIEDWKRCLAWLEKQKEQKPVDYEHEMWKNCEANFEGGKKEVIEHPEKYGLQKPAEWSEEDEDMLNSCISSIEEAKENRYAYRETDGDTSYDHEISWLKSLRNRPKSSDTWKPSEEQMAALEAATVRYQSTGLESLYEDLKKL